MNIIQDARTYALAEISKYGIPYELHFEISEKKALELAETLKADKMIVMLFCAELKNTDFIFEKMSLN